MAEQHQQRTREHPRYRYVGPAEIRARERDAPPGVALRQLSDLQRWLAARAPGPGRAGSAVVTVTFVVTPDGVLRIADRRSEHVACAGGGEVLAAGELEISARAPLEITGASNQSTGYCPEPRCWHALAPALDRLGIPHPGGFTFACEFRRCPACGERNLVKDGWLECALCGADLPKRWNFASATSPPAPTSAP